jgi:prevent-host-death family protein
MRTVSALEVRRRFGQLLDEAANGERLIIERAGQPIAALVPLSDLPAASREDRIRQRLEAIDDIARLARQRPVERSLDAAALIREQRRLRDEQIMRAVRSGRSAPK